MNRFIILSSFFFFFFFFFTTLANATSNSNNEATEKVTFHGHSVLRIHIETTEQLHSLETLAIDMLDLDIWTREGQLGLGTNDVHINPHQASHQHFVKTLEALAVPTETWIPDVQAHIEQTAETHVAATAGFFEAYHSYTEYYTYVKDLCLKHADQCHFIPSIGKSLEGRDLFAVRVGRNANLNRTQVDRIYFEGGQHAREWIGPITVIYVLEQLLTTTDADIVAILQNVEFDIVPLVNPDGYTFSRTTNRLWRKNRRVNPSTSCRGVDLNRNWDSHFGGAGTSSNPCSDTFHGARAFSEPETTAVSNWITKLGNEGNILGAIDFHSYSQLFLRPYGWTTQRCPDETSLSLLGAGFCTQLQDVYGTKYQNIRSVELYPTTGTASDWFYEGASIWASYTIELRDTGRYGFNLPPSEIIPSGKETWAGIKFYIQAVVQDHPRMK